MIENPIGTAKALIRPMICAPDGKLLLVSDYSGIENRVLAWLAGDQEALDDFSAGIDQYKVMASARYGVPYDQVTKDQRFMGKVIILGCGYQMGAQKFLETCWLQFGVTISLEEAKLAVQAYRQKYPLIVALWEGLKQAMARAVLTGQRQTFGKITCGLAKINNIYWLAMQLPSGKSLYYMAPQIKQMLIKDWEHMGPVPTVTHMGVDPYKKKWTRLRLTPGRITENATQGSAREIMAQGLMNVYTHMPEVALLASVHDEGIGMIDEHVACPEMIDRFNYHLCDIPWAKDLPLKAEGWIGKRYKK